MVSFDTLTRLDTLTFSSIAGSNRQNTIMEVEIQYEYTSINRAGSKEVQKSYRSLFQRVSFDIAL